MLLFTAFISTSPELTCPGLLAPDRLDASSRRVSSRIHGRSEDRGYVVPQASDPAVAGDARWGGRPMAEHRVMSEDHLGLTHYRSRRCYESQPIHYRAAFASSLIPSPLPHRPPLQSAFPRGETTGLLRSPFRSLRGWVVPYRPVVLHPRQGKSEPLCLTTYLFGSSLTAS